MVTMVGVLPLCQQAGKEEKWKEYGQSFHKAKLAKSGHFTEKWDENRANGLQV
jgi:hypothetical protein